MSTRIAIDGAGRIGMDLLRIIYEDKEDIDVAAVNGGGDHESDIRRFAHDSVYGDYKGSAVYADGSLLIDGKKILYFHEYDVEKLPWQDLNIDVVIDASDNPAYKHVSAGAKRVVVASPADRADITVVMGVNHNMYRPERHKTISLTNPAVNCIAPIMNIIHKKFYILKGNVTVISPYCVSDTDCLTSKASNFTIPPRAADNVRSIGCVIPELEGKFNGISLMAPTDAVSLADMNLMVGKQTNVVAINEYLKAMAAGPHRGILSFNEKQLPMSDFKGDHHSAIIEPLSTVVSDGNIVKIMAAYDNEYGYCHRIIDFIKYIG